MISMSEARERERGRERERERERERVNAGLKSALSFKRARRTIHLSLFSFRLFFLGSKEVYSAFNTMPSFKDARRRMKQAALQSMGVAEKSDDSEFKAVHEKYHGTVASVRALKRAMTDHAEALRKASVTASALTLQLAAFHRSSSNRDAVRELGKIFAEVEEIQMSSFQRLFDEEVQYVPSEILAEEKDIEERTKRRKQLVLDFDSHQRKFKAVKKDLDEASAGVTSHHRRKMFGSGHSRRNSEGTIAEHLAARKSKLDDAESAVVEATEYLFSRFSYLENERASGGLLSDSIAAFVASELHVAQYLTRRLSVLQNKFPGTEQYRRQLKMYDMEIEETIRAGVVFEPEPRSRDKSDSNSFWKKSFSTRPSASSSVGSVPLPKKKPKGKLKNFGKKFGSSGSGSRLTRPPGGSISATTIPLPPPPPRPSVHSSKLFGVNLAALSKKDTIVVGSLRIPRVLHNCVEYLRDCALTTEGLFRVPGSTATVNEMKAAYDQGKTGIFELVPGVDVHDVGTLLKLYLRELPDPVFPANQYAGILAPVRQDRDAALPGTVNSIIENVNAMPKVNRDAVVYLLAFLSQVSAQDDVNKMTSTNIARCFAPTVLKPAGEMNMGAMLNDVPVTIAVVKTLIENAAAFGDAGALGIAIEDDDDDDADSVHSYTASTPKGTPTPEIYAESDLHEHDPDL